MPANQAENKDVLPDGFGDPMLMSVSNIEAHIEEFKSTGDVQAENFLRGVLYAKVSLIASLLEKLHRALILTRKELPHNRILGGAKFFWGPG